MDLRGLRRRYDNLLNEYEEIMIGNRKVFSDRYFGATRPESQKNALAVIQYAIEKYLRWKPSVAARRLTKDIVVQLHLNTVMKYIKFPPEYSRERDFFYAVALIYPNFSISRRQRIVYVYKKLLDGTIVKFPRAYFMGEDGYVRACVCLQYLISEYLQTEIQDAEDAYTLFASDRGTFLLRKYKLLKVSEILFETPVEFVHAALPDGERDSFLVLYYNYVYYSRLLEKEKAEEAKKNKKNNSKKKNKKNIPQATTNARITKKRG